MRTFDFGRAAQLYDRGVHPRVMLGPADLDAVRRRTRVGEGKMLLHALRKKVQPYVERILADDGWRDALAKGQHFWPKREMDFVWSLPDIAMIGSLDRDSQAIDAAARVLRAAVDLGLDPKANNLIADGYYLPPVHVPFAYDLLAPHLDDAARRHYVAWAVEGHIRRSIQRFRAVYLRGSAHNMTLGGMVIALTTLLAVKGDPGAPNLDGEQAELLRWFEATLNTAVGPDGYPEEDMGYGTVVVPLLAQVAEPLARAGIFNAYESCPQLGRFGNAMLHFVQPWGDYLANTGDHGDQLRDRQFILARQATRSREPALLWLLGALTYEHGRTFIGDRTNSFEIETRWRKGSIPVSWLTLTVLSDLTKEAAPKIRRVPTAFLDRGRGLVSFRSGWDKDATFVVFDGSQRSPAAPGHAHDSCGHFSLSALGEYFAIDTGRYSFEQECHNVVLVNGRSGRSTNGQWACNYEAGRLIDYQPGAFVDTAAVDSSHQHNCIWARRTLGFVKSPGGDLPSYVWTIDDINANNDWGSFWWQLHSSPENEITIEGNRATIRGWRYGNMLDVHFALPAPEFYPKPFEISLTQDISKPSSREYIGDTAKKVAMYDRPSDMLHGPIFERPRLTARVDGWSGRFMAIMLPRAKGEKAAVVERIPSLDNTLAVTITFPKKKVRDTLIWAYEHRMLEAGDVNARGDWCVVRQSLTSGAC